MATEFDDSLHYAMFKGAGAYRTGNAFDVRWSEITLAALRAAGVLDNMVDGTVPPVDTDLLWLDKNHDPAQLKVWDSTGLTWVLATFAKLFDRNVHTLKVTPLVRISGSANLISVVEPADFFDGLLYSVTPVASNTGNMFITVQGVGTYPVMYSNDQHVQPNEMRADAIKVLLYYGSKFYVLFPTADAFNAMLDAQAAAAEAESYRDQAAGYVNDIVSEKEVPIYGTVQGLTALLIPAGLTAFRTNGFAAMGDGGEWPLVVEVANTGDLEPWQRLTNGGTRRWELSASVINAEMLGASPAASAATNSAAVNAAIRLQHLRGGGEVRLFKPGTYLLANTNPYPASSYPGLSEVDANWWANRRAIWIPYDNITLRLGEGVTLKVGDGENCHAIQMGQFSLGMGGAGPAIPAISLNNSRVVGGAWAIDMNGANQNPATDTKDHPAGIIVNHGSERIEICGGKVFNSSYYGIGFEGTDSDALQGYRKCHVHDMVIESCKADGFDAKDFGTLSADNVLTRVTVRNVGNGGGAFLTGQAGIDTRGGWTVEDCTVYFDDAFTGERIGFRSQYAPDYAQSSDPTHFVRCRAIGNGKANIGTIGFRLTGRNARADDCTVTAFEEGFRVSAPKHILRGETARSCGIAYRFFSDAGAGWDADNSSLRDSFIENCDIGWRTDAGVSGVQIAGGGLDSVATALVENGTGTIIRDVSGLRTYNKATVQVDVASVGRKTFAINHGLPFTPLVTDVTLHAIRTAFDSNLDWSGLMVTGVSSSQVTGELRVVTAGAAGLFLQVMAEVSVKRL